METLKFLPEQQGYVVERSKYVLQQGADSAHIISTRLHKVDTAIISCQWLLTTLDSVEFCRFITRRENDCAPFYIDLIFNGNFVVQHTAYLIGGTFALTQVQGTILTYTANLEVIRNGRY